MTERGLIRSSPQRPVVVSCEIAVLGIPAGIETRVRPSKRSHVLNGENLVVCQRSLKTGHGYLHHAELITITGKSYRLKHKTAEDQLGKATAVKPSK